MFSLEETRKAHEVVLSALRQTPALSWPLLSARLGAEAVVKHENHQPTGAFKVRGGLTYVEALMRREPQVKGLISATRGNHGQSLAFAGATVRRLRHDRRASRQLARRRMQRCARLARS